MVDDALTQISVNGEVLRTLAFELDITAGSLLQSLEKFTSGKSKTLSGEINREVIAGRLEDLQSIRIRLNDLVSRAATSSTTRISQIEDETAD